MDDAGLYSHQLLKRSLLWD